MEKRYQGVYPVVFTPLTTDGAVDVPALQRIVEYLIEKGVHGLLILGSNGESPFLTDGERRQVITATVEACDGRVPVVVGTTHMGTGTLPRVSMVCLGTSSSPLRKGNLIVPVARRRNRPPTMPTSTIAPARRLGPSALRRCVT